MQELPRHYRNAYRSFEYAARKQELKPADLKDFDAHEFLISNGIEDKDGSFADLTDYKPLTKFVSWRTYLSKARNALNENKHRSRAGRAHGSSIVRADQRERSKTDA